MSADDGSTVANEDGRTGREESRGRLARVEGRLRAVRRGLEVIRADATRRRRAFVISAILGLTFAWVHWIGLVVAGALVGLTRPSGRGGIAAGFGIGAFAVLATVVLTPAMSPGEFVGLTPVNYLTVAAGFVLPVWGSFARYVV